MCTHGHGVGAGPARPPSSGNWVAGLTALDTRDQLLADGVQLMRLPPAPCQRCEERFVDPYALAVSPGPSHPGGWASIDEVLQKARAGLDRVLAKDLAAEVAAGALVVDIRPVDQRLRDGDVPDAIVVDRNVLEWRLDPTCPHRLPVADDAGRRIIVVCNEGYSSSLAAASLQQLGLHEATDLVGGYQEWLAVTGREAPTANPSASHLLQRNADQDRERAGWRSSGVAGRRR
jgi:rhodanese-related sulfurtransferase